MADDDFAYGFGSTHPQFFEQASEAYVRLWILQICFVASLRSFGLGFYKMVTIPKKGAQQALTYSRMVHLFRSCWCAMGFLT